MMLLFWIETRWTWRPRFTFDRRSFQLLADARWLCFGVQWTKDLAEFDEVNL